MGVFLDADQCDTDTIAQSSLMDKLALGKRKDMMMTFGSREIT